MVGEHKATVQEKRVIDPSRGTLEGRVMCFQILLGNVTQTEFYAKGLNTVSVVRLERLEVMVGEANGAAGKVERIVRVKPDVAFAVGLFAGGEELWGRTSVGRCLW